MMTESNEHSTLWDNLKQLALFLLFFVILKTSVAEAYKIPSSSMEDTLLIGDFLVANKFVYGARIPLVDWRLPAINRPEPGDIVIFIFPLDSTTKYIKRCVAGPGDTVELVEKVLYVNGVLFPNPEHAKFTGSKMGGLRMMGGEETGGGNYTVNFGPYVVPEDSYFMMGDNRDNSYDSRAWGSVPYDNILGKALFIHWSWDDSVYRSSRVSLKDPLSVPRTYINDAVHFFQKVRWNRLFRGIE